MVRVSLSFCRPGLRNLIVALSYRWFISRFWGVKTAQGNDFVFLPGPKFRYSVVAPFPFCHYRMAGDDCYRIVCIPLRSTPLLYPIDDGYPRKRYRDRIASAIRQRLDEPSLTLAQVLESATWKGGREIARRKRPGTGGPPIDIESDGTVF